MSLLTTKQDLPSDILHSFTHGIDVDILLAKEEIAVQKAWVKGLVELSIISESDGQMIQTLLDKFLTEVTTDKGLLSEHDEDIHIAIERYLTENLGDLGKKIHIGRSRNDLIATSLRLYTANQINENMTLLRNLVLGVEQKASEWGDVIVPALTHSQSGQAIRLSHLFSAHGEFFKNDLIALKNAKDSCLRYLPLGAAACTGTHLKIDLEKIANDLGFHSTLQNSYHAVSDRDFMLETLNAYALVASHIIRLVNEIMYYSSTHVGLLKLPKALATGSSIMPNKRNPDVAEIVRAKMNRVISCAFEAINIAKSILPSYCSDLHELKRTFVTANKELNHSLMMACKYVEGLGVDHTIAAGLLDKGHILATDIANDLVANKGQTFRNAYHQLKSDIALADSKGIQVHELEKYQDQFGYLAAVEARSNCGGTG